MNPNFDISMFYAGTCHITLDAISKSSVNMEKSVLCFKYVFSLWKEKLDLWYLISEILLLYEYLLSSDEVLSMWVLNFPYETPIKETMESADYLAGDRT